MKINKYIYALSLATIVFCVAGCQKILDETPRTVFTTAYLKSPAGLQSAVDALYSGMRFNYGPMGAMLIMNNGTDEITSGDQGFNQTGEVQLGNYTINSSNGHILTPWNRNYSNINLANGVVELAPEVSMDENIKTRIVAEARFLRGLYYFLLVQQFGAVPLDLGSGELAFNQSAFQGFNRLNTAELFVRNYQVIIADLKFAAENLPNVRSTPTGVSGQGAFTLHKAAALHMLSKAYVFRGYSAAKVSTDFDSAYIVANSIITNQALYNVGLLQDFGDVHREGNDYNKELLFSIERIPGNHLDNEVASPSSEFTNKANISNNFFNCNYPSISAAIPERVLEYGRPLRQLAPTPYVYNEAFIDKYYDSRYHNTFRTMWKATVNAGELAVGDTAIYLAGSESEAQQLKLQGKKYRILAPSEFYLPSRPAIQVYPNLQKYDDNLRATVNDISGRPFVVSKLSEVYLLAAEAAMQSGKTSEALQLILTLRKRAAYRPGLSATELADRQEQMTKINTGTAQVPVWTNLSVAHITLDFIMQERTRELFGESIRWADLAGRGLLVDRVKKYNTLAAPNVQAHHALRPIPQSQLDAMNDPDKAKYQNPGY